MKTNIFRVSILAIFTPILISCGGGGGGGTPDIPSTPVPTVSVSLSEAKTTVGSSVTLTWSSTNATTCAGDDALTAGPLLTSGSKTISPTSGGQFIYTISCDGAGGTTKKSASLVVPIPVTTNSYANWKEIGLTATVFPTESYINAGATNGPMAYGWADFFHIGARDLFTAHTRFYDAINDPTVPRTSLYTTITNNQKYYSDFQFWHLNNDGTYTKLWEQKGCKAPRKALIADFNIDGYPDVYVTCHDVDSETGIFTQGEYSFIVLSDGKGGYNASPLQDTLGYHHGAAVADFNNDGYPDIFLSNNLLLINDKDGTFTSTGSVISLAIFPGPQAQYYSYEAMDVDGDGNIDLIAGGDEQRTNGNPLDITTAIFYGDGTGHFNRYKKIPTVAGRGLVLDFTMVTNNGIKSLYIARTSGYDSGLTGSQCYSGSYCSNTLQTVNLATMESAVILDLLTPPLTSNDKSNFPFWWIPTTKNGVNGVGVFNAFSGDNLIHFITH